jgi:hypothetical protein
MDLKIPSAAIRTAINLPSEEYRGYIPGLIIKGRVNLTTNCECTTPKRSTVDEYAKKRYNGDNR